MTEFDNLQEIWKQQKQSALPDVSVIIARAKKEKQIFTNKILFQITTLIASMIGVAFVVATVDFKMATTFIGVGLMFLCVFGFTAIRLYQIMMLKKIDFTKSPSKNLAELEKFYIFQQFVGTKITLAYFVILNIAFGFYFIEVMHPMPILMKTIVLAVYVAWMLFAYFYLGKRQKAKEFERIQRMIDGIKEIEQNYQK